MKRQGMLTRNGKGRSLGGTLLCGLLAAASLSLPARAARTVPVQVDGDVLPAACYLEQGVTYVPLRTLMDAFGGWEVFWDAQEQEAVVLEMFFCSSMMSMTLCGVFSSISLELASL